MKTVRLALAFIFAFLAIELLAQDHYPSKSIKLIVGFSPGGAADGVGRALAESLTQRLGQPVVVENRAGANGNIAAEAVAKSLGDGYTLYFPSIGHAVNPALYKGLNFDPLLDFTPIGGVLSAPNMLVVPSSSAFKNLSELIAYAKVNPSKLTFASSGKWHLGAFIGGVVCKNGKHLSFAHPLQGHGKRDAGLDFRSGGYEFSKYS